MRSASYCKYRARRAQCLVALEFFEAKMKAPRSGPRRAPGRKQQRMGSGFEIRHKLPLPQDLTSSNSLRIHGCSQWLAGPSEAREARRRQVIAWTTVALVGHSYTPATVYFRVLSAGATRTELASNFYNTGIFIPSLPQVDLRRQFRFRMSRRHVHIGIRETWVGQAHESRYKQYCMPQYGCVSQF